MMESYSPMTKLSICIPVEPGMTPPLSLCERLLSAPEADIEIIVAPYGEPLGDDHPLNRLAGTDARLRVLPAAPEGISLANLWIGTVAAMRADWVTIIRPDDMLDTAVDVMLRHVEATMPDADAVGWNNFQIDPAARRDVPVAIAVPVQHHLMEIDKKTMLEAFFHWTDSTNVPKMPFGLYHGAIRRGLLETVLAHSGELSWLTPVPQHEWAARILIHANRLAFSSRPLSAISQMPYQPATIPRVISNMPFTPAQGVTGAIAEVQCRVLHDLGSSWDGIGDGFVRACMIDCVMENDRSRFDAKCQAYRAAFIEIGDQRLLAGFQPPYRAEPQSDRRRGLHGQVLLVDRFLGNAETAQQFYDYARYMLTPVDVAAELSGTPQRPH